MISPWGLITWLKHLFPLGWAAGVEELCEAESRIVIVCSRGVLPWFRAGFLLLLLLPGAAGGCSGLWVPLRDHISLKQQLNRKRNKECSGEFVMWGAE